MLGGLFYLVIHLVVYLHKFTVNADIYRLIFHTSHSLENIEIWMLLWLLILNDYCIKYATIIIKCLITLAPKTIISYQQKVSEQYFTGIKFSLEFKFHHSAIGKFAKLYLQLL